MLPCIAAVAIISGYGGMKTYLLQAKNSYELLAQNAEALSQNEGGFFIPCYQDDNQCVYNAKDAGGNKVIVTISNAIKAAPFK